MNIFSIFSRAAQNLPLTPGQRAFLKLLQNWLLTALGAGITAGAQYALGNQHINFTALAYLIAGAFGLSLLSALNKFWSAQGDTPLVLASAAAEQKVQQAVQSGIQQGVLSPDMAATGTVNLQPSQSNQNPNLTAQNVPVAQLQFQPVDRHFGDSVVMPAVQPQQPGQPQ